jgi:hypothetical protein
VTDLVPGQPATSSYVASKLRWLVAIAAGVTASVAAAVAFAAVVPGGPSRASTGTVIGLVFGSAATGTIVKAHGARSWAIAAALTFVGQLVVGIVLVMLVIPFLSPA